MELPASQGRGYAFKMASAYLAILADLVLNCVIDPPFTSFVGMIALFTVHGVVVFASAIVMYILFIDTPLLQAGLFGLWFREFRWLFITTFSHIVFTIALRGYRLVAIADYWPFLFVWNMPFYYILYMLQKLIAAAYYVVYFRTTFELQSDVVINPIVKLRSV
eukprot:tig00020800_g13737.t1